MALAVVIQVTRRAAAVDERRRDVTLGEAGQLGAERAAGTRRPTGAWCRHSMWWQACARRG